MHDLERENEGLKVRYLQVAEGRLIGYSIDIAVSRYQSIKALANSTFDVRTDS
jgi:hypothetical protein